MSADWGSGRVCVGLEGRSAGQEHGAQFDRVKKPESDGHGQRDAVLAVWPSAEARKEGCGTNPTTGPEPARAKGRPKGVPLRPDRALAHAEGACLPLRSTLGQCRRCAEVCPVDALSVSPERVALSERCIGCGRCVAACPTEALSLPEIESARSREVAPGVVRVECRKVPDALLSPNTLVLPCTGALTLGDVLMRSAAGAVVQVIDRGWCTNCPANRGAASADASHPAEPVIEEATLWLEAVGADIAPSLSLEPLPRSAQRAEEPPPSAGEDQGEPPLGRRALFRRAFSARPERERSSIRPMGSGGRAAYPAEARLPSPERERRLAALGTLAARSGRPIPAEAFPNLHVDARCCDQRMCVALCPTGALRMAERAGEAELVFASDRCLGCGACIRACPEGALQLSQVGGAPTARVLVRHSRLACASCGEMFTPTRDQLASPGEAICQTCQKAQRFTEDAMRQLFGAATN